MKCDTIGCGARLTVMDSRGDDEAFAVWRKRWCPKCEKETTTVETLTTKKWMTRGICSEPGCAAVPPLGKKVCLVHRREHSREFMRQQKRDLQFKTGRRCKNHPDRQATLKATLLQCDECYKKWMKERRNARRTILIPTPTTTNKLKATSGGENLRDVFESYAGDSLRYIEGGKSGWGLH